ncbi:MAG: non-homologous end-joining DNA ligase [Candidatus Micrarchaeia archaeon]|jgi:bifunctional non-homologous end joining protein LigD
MSLWDEKIKPMLAEKSKAFNDKDFLFEIKFDGTRAISYIDTEKKEVRMLNRRMLFFQERYPELKEIWKNINARRVIVDGEIVVFKNGVPDFYSLQEREQAEGEFKWEILSRVSPATYVVFDILYKDENELISLPLIKRKEILKETIKEDERLLISQYIIENGKEFFEEVKKKGLEGIMAKRITSTYQIGKRSKDWLKIKVLDTIDCIICGFTKGEGWREEYFGALILGCFHNGELIYVGRCGTGLSEEGYSKITEKLQAIKSKENPFRKEIEELKGKEVTWVEPKIVCEVKFMSITPELKLRAPSFVKIRNDKPVEECVI